MGQVRFVIPVLCCALLIGCAGSDEISPDQGKDGVYYRGPMDKPRKGPPNGATVDPDPRGRNTPK